MTNYSEQLAAKGTQAFRGKVVERIRYLTFEEQDKLMWYEPAPVVVFTDGSYIFASSDHEGNSAGAFFTSDEGVPVL